MSFRSILFHRSGIVRRARRSTAPVPMILAILIVALVGGCAQARNQSASPPRVSVPAIPVAVDDDSGKLPEATTFGNIAGAPPDPAPQASTGGTVLHVQHDLGVYNAPGGTVFARLPAMELSSPTWVPVIAQQGQWAHVLLPSRPNNSTGWVRIDDPAGVELAKTPYEVDVNIAARRLVLRKDGRQVDKWTVAVGKPSSPTPRGRTFIMASIKETVTNFSPIILPLGTHSQTFDTYGGGPGTVALHGWPDPSVFGHAASDGCVRVPADALRQLMSLPLGTLVLLS